MNVNIGEGLKSYINKAFKNNRSEIKENKNNFDPRVIKLDYPKGEYSDINEKNKYEIWNGQYSGMIGA